MTSHIERFHNAYTQTILPLFLLFINYLVTTIFYGNFDTIMLIPMIPKLIITVYNFFTQFIHISFCGMFEI